MMYKRMFALLVLLCLLPFSVSFANSIDSWNLACPYMLAQDTPVYANIDEDPSKNGPLIMNIAKGTFVQATHFNRGGYGYYSISVFGLGLVGYCSADYVIDSHIHDPVYGVIHKYKAELLRKQANGSDNTNEPTKPSDPSPNSSVRAKTTTSWEITVGAAEGAALLANPALDEEPLATLAQGDALSLLSLGTAWCKVSANGQTGYMRTSALAFTTEVGTDIAASRALAVVRAPKAGKLTLRKTASTQAASLKSVPNGTILAVLGEDGAFTCVNAGGTQGYLLTEYLDFYAAIESITQATVQLPKGTSGTTVNLREEESMTSRRLARVPVGTAVTVLEQGTDWCLVETDGLLGRMMTKYLVFDE